MDISTAALVVSICSATVTLGALIAQFILYRLSGARLKVQLVFTYAEDGIRSWSVGPTRKPILFSDTPWDHPDPFGIEVGRVRVTNIGRTALSVENISFDVTRSDLWNIRRHRTTMQPYIFRHKDTPKDEKLLDVSKPMRLEPGAHVTAEFNLWPALAGASSGTMAGPIAVRGSALAVGRKRATRSSRRTAWKLPPRALSIFPDVRVTPELRAFRELWSHHHGRVETSLALMMHREINQLLAKGGSHTELKEFLDGHTERLADPDDPWANGLLAYYVHEAYHRETPGFLDTPPDPAPNRSKLHRLLWGHH